MALSATVREPHRLMLFALALLIHIGLFALLLSSRQQRLEFAERGTTLVFLPDTPRPQTPPLDIAPPPLPQLPNASPPSSTAPQLIAPPKPEQTPAPPAIDWHRDAEQVARDHALSAEAARDHKDDNGPPQPKPQFRWSHSRTHRIDPMESGGFVVWLSDKCGVAVTVMAMPFCKFGKEQVRGDLFEHMDDPPKPGDWKDE